jgi:hypothetical protein
MKDRVKQKGAVSIFIVIFCALFVTIITVSFVGIMVRNQLQSTNADLAESAYDSALAGVEDAKRLMLIYRRCVSTSDTTSQPCVRARDGMTLENVGSRWTSCNSINKGLDGVNTNAERKIQRSAGSSGDDLLDQAYTCVKINYNTTNFEKSVENGQSDMIPLESGGTAFSKVRISWFKRDAGSTNALGYYGTPPLLPTQAAWNSPAGDQPPIIRAQLIQVGPTFNLDQFDGGTVTNSNTNTTFLYPAAAGSNNVTISAIDNRSVSSPKAPHQVTCSNGAYTGGAYACSVILTLPAPVTGARAAAYLRIGSFYAATDYKIELLDGSDGVVPFVGVQPEVDSTGRANDLFRRVGARVEFISSFDYPEAAIETNGNLCKDFGVTDDANDFNAINTPLCQP